MRKNTESRKLVVVEIPEDLLASFLAEAIEAAQQHNLPVELADDWRQEMCFAVWERIGLHNGSLSSRRTFMKRLAEWRLDVLVREATGKRLGAWNRPLDSTCFSEDGNTEREECPYKREVREGGVVDERDAIVLKLDLAAASEKFPQDIRKTYELLKVYEPKEVAEISGKSTRAIYRHMAAIRDILTSLDILPANVRPSQRR